MKRIEVSFEARLDIIGILAWSEDRHGPAARTRYERLILTCLDDLAEDSGRPTTFELTDRRPGLRGYHLRQGRRRARLDGQGVGTPRHLIICSADAVRVRIHRVLHEVMDMTRRLADLPDED